MNDRMDRNNIDKETLEKLKDKFPVVSIGDMIKQNLLAKALGDNMSDLRKKLEIDLEYVDGGQLIGFGGEAVEYTVDRIVQREPGIYAVYVENFLNPTMHYRDGKAVDPLEDHDITYMGTGE